MEKEAELEGLLERLKAAVDTKDLLVLDPALAECEGAGLPQRDLQEAKDAKAKFELLLAKLKIGVTRSDLAAIKDALGECRSAELPEHALREAVAAQA
ncbi:unnamed protein product, partial [Prorocentrum cordatum]